MNIRKIQHHQQPLGQGLDETMDPHFPFSLPPDDSSHSEADLTHILQQLHNARVQLNRACQDDHNEIVEVMGHLKRKLSSMHDKLVSLWKGQRSFQAQLDRLETRIANMECHVHCNFNYKLSSTNKFI